MHTKEQQPIEAICLGMFAVIHNDLKLIAAELADAYLHAKTNEKLYTILGDDYGELSGKVLVFEELWCQVP